MIIGNYDLPKAPTLIMSRYCCKPWISWSSEGKKLNHIHGICDTVLVLYPPILQIREVTHTREL